MTSTQLTLSTQSVTSVPVSIGEQRLVQIVSTYMENFLSPHTRSAYKTDFDAFGQFLQKNGSTISHPSEITKNDVIAFRDDLRKHYSPTTVNRKLSALSSLFSELKNANVMDHNPVEGIKRPRAVTKKERLGFTDKETLQILEHHPISTLQGLSDRTVLHFLFYTGARVSEAINVRVSDLSEIDDIPVVHIRGKGDKLRTVPLHPRLNHLLKKLVSLRGKSGEEPVFTATQRGTSTPLTRKSVYSLLKKTISELGLSKNRSPHSSRRTVISNLLEAGTAIEDVAQLVGHSDVNTTVRYKVRRQKIEEHALLTLNYKP